MSTDIRRARGPRGVLLAKFEDESHVAVIKDAYARFAQILQSMPTDPTKTPGLTGMLKLVDMTPALGSHETNILRCVSELRVCEEQNVELEAKRSDPTMHKEYQTLLKSIRKSKGSS